MDTLELQLQNDIIMYARTTYPFTKEINGLSRWYNNEPCFHSENKSQWILEAIKLRNEVNFNRYNFWNIDIPFNRIEKPH